MPNYGIFTNFVFCRYLFKKERFPTRENIKTTIATVYVATEICVSRQISSNHQRNHVAITFTVSQDHNIIVDN